MTDNKNKYNLFDIIGKRITLTENLEGEENLPSASKMTKGLQGVITGLEKTPWEQKIEVEWENGANLSILVGVDKFEIDDPERELIESVINNDNKKRTIRI